jgi:outer membrane protein OmpA-like peptidoglycan-associated protein
MRRAALLTLILSAAATPAAAQSCEALVGTFQAAIRAKDPAAGKTAVVKLAESPTCSAQLRPAQRALAVLNVELGEALAGKPGQEREREALLVEADRPGASWEAAYVLGEFRRSQRRWGDAVIVYERAIEIMKDTSKTPEQPPAQSVHYLVSRAQETRLLAANEEKPGATYVRGLQNQRDGTLGGSFSRDVRGVAIASVPLPINFKTNSADPTAIGEQALNELLTALREQQATKIRIVGHTDERGDDAYNLALSQRRAKAVADWLKVRNPSLVIVVEGHGERDKLDLEGLGTLPQEDVWALHRRVEWRRD